MPDTSWLGEAYYLSLQVAQALPRFERAIELDPGLTEAHLKMAEIQRARAPPVPAGHGRG